MQAGARPASGTLSHLSRRIAAAGIDVRNLPGLSRPQLHVQISEAELRREAARCSSVRALARRLDLADDGATRACLRRALQQAGVDVSHFSHARIALPEARLREAVAANTSVAGVVRAMGLPENNASWHKVRRSITRAGIDTGHFRRRPRSSPDVPPVRPRSGAENVLRVTPAGSPRTSRPRLRQALDAVGIKYACGRCGNRGAWQGEPLTLHIDHVNGDWHDNRRENLRYLCPNCHALTDTYCGRNRRTARLQLTRSPESPEPAKRDETVDDTMPPTGGGGAEATQQV
ncbi:HNH endonuclease [Streptomyces sp. WMMC897]|uniref:HNH endonuclease n=1 Tax=Streptomyces sp. WMMC897 TaxID=3014782 RepID=UPI0022B67954|nr:HNH endonuclease [Streptomyces sp. WMMC897]MCZ7414467.1 HNH endonuclease [Streptomyces sp. WMMC897]